MVEWVRAVDGLHDDVGYAYASVAGASVFTAGACPLDAEGAVVGLGDVRAQARRALANLRAALAETGCGFEDVVKTTVYVATTDHAELVAAFEEVEEAFGATAPPSTLVGVTILGYAGQLFEIEAVAARAA